MSVTAAAIPVQLQVTTRSTPPIPPLDLNTWEWPAIWKGGDTVFNIGVFNANGFGVDLSNLESLTLSILPYVDVKNYLGFPQSACLSNVINGDLYVPGINWPAYTTQYPALVTVTVLVNEITPLVSCQRWQVGIAQNAVAVVAEEETAQIDLRGQPSARFTIAVSGTLSSNGSRIIYGSGPIIIYESGITRSILPVS